MLSFMRASIPFGSSAISLSFTEISAISGFSPYPGK